LKSIYQFIFSQKTVQLKIEPLHFEKKWQRITQKTSKVILLLLCGVIIVGTAIENPSDYVDKAYSKSFNGSYEITSLIQNGDTIAAAETDTTRWKKIIIEDGYLGIRTSGKLRKRFRITTDTIAKKIKITSEDDSTKIYSFDYNRLSKDKVVFKGKYEQDTLQLVTKQKKKGDYLLNSTSFKWIQEYPFNR
jgi:hypothetical protein